MRNIYVLATYSGVLRGKLHTHLFNFKGYLLGYKIGQINAFYSGALKQNHEYFFLLEISEIKCNILSGSIKNLKLINQN
jgi:hypothetical protein